MSDRQGIATATRPDQYISATVGSDGTARGAIGPCPEGFVWYVERLTCAQEGAAVASSAIMEIYVLQTNMSSGTFDASKRGRQDLSMGSVLDNGVSDETSAICVPAGSWLVAYWSGLTSGDVVHLSSQIQQRKLVLEHELRGRHAHTMEHRPDRKPSDMIAAGFNPPDQDAEI